VQNNAVSHPKWAMTCSENTSFRVSGRDSLQNKLSSLTSNRWFWWPSGHYYQQELPGDFT